MIRPLNALVVCAVLAATPFVGSTEAQAQGLEERFVTRPTVIESPERVLWDIIRIGVYEPEAAAGLGLDKGPRVATEADVILYRIPYVGPIGLGARFAWSRHDGPAPLDANQDGIPDVDSEGNIVPSGEEIEFKAFSLAPLAFIRIDTLARELGVPFVFTGKVGFDIVPWSASTGGAGLNPFGDGTVSLGLTWGAQVAFELDILEPKAARRLDEEWGINHTYVFFELWGTTAGAAGANTRDLSDTLSFTGGLGFHL